MTAGAEHASARILVVEDEAITAWDLEQSLLELGFEVAGIAGTAEDAMGQARATRPDLVLMDIRLKGPVDGIVAADQIRRELGVPIVYLTAHGDRETLDRAKRTEPHAYLLKPFKKAELQSVVEVALYRHAMERRLRERERLLATTLRSIGDAVLTTDAEGRVTFLNPVAERLTGWTHEEARGRPVAEVLVLRDERTDAPVAIPVGPALAEDAARAAPGVRLVARDGRATVVSDSVAPVTDGDERLGAVVVFRDVGEQRRMQQQLEFADRLAAFGTMAAGIAHEINNPLAYVVGNVHFSIDRLLHFQQHEPVAEAVAALKEAAEGGRRIAKIVEDLRTFSRPPEPGATTVDLRAVLRWAIDVTTPAWRTRAHVLTRFDVVPQVRADETRLGQVFINLLVNAAQAIRDDGEPQEIRVETHTDARGDAVVEVIDTGVGMTPAVRARLFEPFFTTKPPGQGTGLGLSVCRGIVESLGGRIEVESEPGRGARFRVVLPGHRAAGAERPGARESTPEGATSPRGRVLLVDDDEAVLRSIERTLRAHHEVTCESSSLRALARLEGGEVVDLVLCDVTMPELSGLELYRRVSARRPDLADRIVLLTGGGALDAAAREGKPLPKHTLLKPFDPRALRALVATIVAAPRP